MVEPGLATVVIPCRNGGRSLHGCLSAVNGQTIRNRLRVIVVDNGSTDDSVAIARRLADQVSFEGRPGSSAARNRGLADTLTPFYLSLDADCRPSSPTWAEAHIRSLVHNADMIACSAGALAPAPSHDRWARRIDATPHPAFHSDGSPLYGVGGNSCYRTAALRSIGGFPALRSDDWGAGHLLRRSGYRLVWTPEAEVYHENQDGAMSYFRQMRKVGWYGAEAEAFAGRQVTLGRAAYLRQLWRVAKSLGRHGPIEGYAVGLKAAGQCAGARDFIAGGRAPKETSR